MAIASASRQLDTASRQDVPQTTSQNLQRRGLSGIAQQLREARQQYVTETRRYRRVSGSRTSITDQTGIRDHRASASD
ncbi:hypothetical protein [Paraburkholderia kururiensis]